MKKNLSGFISILLCLMLVWTLIPNTAFAEKDEDLSVSWGDQADGCFMAASDEADFGDVYRSCPFVTRKIVFYWSQDGDPDHIDSNVTVMVPPVADSLFRIEVDGNQLTVTPEQDMLPEEDGVYTETVMVYVSLGDYETAERKQEIELTLTMDLKDGDPVFEINNAEDLLSFAALVNLGYTDISAVLASDITLNEELLDDGGALPDETEDLVSWIPIGSTKETAFEGVFDGSGFTISGLYMDTDEVLGGLFGVLKGTVKNVRIEDSWIESTGNAGALAAWNQGTIQNTSADGFIFAGSNAGGIAGLNEGEIARSYTTGTAELSENDDDAPGGDAGIAGPVCGINYGSIDLVYYLSDSETDDIDSTRAMNADQFASGELCWLLNEGLDEPVFFQDLGDDDAPVLYETHWNVYRGYRTCADTDPIYANEELPEERPAHALTAHEGIDAACGETGSSAYWSCDNCGKYFADAEGTSEIEAESWIIPAVPHVLEGHEAVSPTCTEGGSSAYWSCTVCGKYFADAEGTAEIADGSWVLPPSGHALTAHEAVNASCAAGGNSAYWSCDVCGKYFADAEGTAEIADGSWILPPTAHTLTAHDEVAPTCTAGGSSAYWSCEVCGKYFADAEGTTEIADGSWVLPPTAHTLTAHDAVTPSCTEGGSSAYWSCDVCGKYFADAEGTTEIADGSWVLPPAGHQLTAHEAVAASCAAEGNSAYWSCDACGKYFSDVAGTSEIADGSWVIAKTAHQLTAHDAVAPTCTAGGSSAYWSCDTCGKYFSDKNGKTEIAADAWVLPALGHQLTAHDAVAPTCTEGGSSAYWHCDTCGKYFSDAEGSTEIADGSWALPAAGHQLTAHEAVAATCAAEGNSAYWSCDACGKFFSDKNGKTEIANGSWVIAKTAHQLTAHDAVAPTCTAGGSSAYWSCEACGKFFSDKDGKTEIAADAWILPALGHQLTAHDAVAPTCTEGGNSAYWSCDTCGKYFSDAAGTAEITDGSWVLPPAGHQLTAHEAVAASCAAEGSSAYWSCDTCGKFFSDKDGKTEIANGSWVIAKTAHQLTAHDAVAPTCTAGGSSAYWSCDTCGKYFSDKDGKTEISADVWILPALGHQLTAHDAVAASCTEGGSTAYWSCEACGKFFSDAEGTSEIEKDSWILPAKGHTLSAHEAVDATCAAEGSSAYWSCDVCGKYFSDKNGNTEIADGSWVIAKTAHQLTAHDAVAPTCTEGGNSAYWSCDFCGKYFSDKDGKTEIAADAWILPALDHQLTAHDVVAPTCTEAGNSVYWSCESCGKFFSDAEGTAEIEKDSWVLPAKGHTLAAHEAVNATCTAEGSSAYWSCDTCGKFFSDAEGTTEIEKDSWVIEKTAHQLTAHDAIQPTCTEEGSSAYWSCETCEKFFSDAEGTTEIEKDSWILPAAGHTLTAHEAGIQTCTEGGSIAYWSCDVCGKFFGDEEGTTEIEEDSWILPPSPHTLTAHEAKEPTCTEDGNNVYWSCDYCGKFFSDAEGTTEIEKDSWILSAEGHKPEAHEAVEPTCTEGGNIAYWSCETCGKYFEDEACTKEIEEEELALPAAGHTLTAHEAGIQTCTEGGSVAYWSCDVCGKFFGDEEGTTEIEEDSWILPPSPHTLTAHEAVEPTCTEGGSSAYWSCEVCEKFFKDEKAEEEVEKDSWELPALGHDYVNGTCSRCGEKDPSVPETQPTSSESEVTPTVPTVPEPTMPPTNKETDPIPVTMPESSSESPTAPTEYLISISDDGHGKASASPAFASTGVTVTLTAKPNEGYQFKEWQVLSGGVKITGNKFTVGSSNVEIKALFEKIPTTPPSIIGGNGSTWIEGSKTGVTMTCDGDFFSFTDLKIDGSVIAKKNYEVSAGSVIVELKPEYLNTLAEGEHKVTFVFGKLESDEGRFTISGHNENPVRKVNVVLWIIIVAASLGLIASIIVLLVGRKKTSQYTETEEDISEDEY